jgi:outer membrane lipoprotein carrier protein
MRGGRAGGQALTRAEPRTHRPRLLRTLRSLSSASALAALAVLPARAQDVAATLAKADRAYAAVHTLRAEFEQTITNPMLGAPATSRGTMFLVKPNRFAMRFSEPEGDRIVADGTWLWAYTPSTVPGQVIRQAVPTSGTATPNLFAQFVERPLERYDVAPAGHDTVAGEPVDLVTLVPKAHGLGFRRATIAVATGTGWIRRVQIVEDSGQHRTLVLTSITPDASVPRAEVEFRVPRGVKVVTGP